MVFLKLLTVAVIFAVEVAGNDLDCLEGSAYDNIPIDVVAPVFYIINFNVKYHPVILGDTNILLNINRTVKRISFHVDGLEVDVDSIRFSIMNTKSEIYKIINKFHGHYCQATQTMTLIFERNVYPGKYNLYMKFELYVADNKSTMQSDVNHWLFTTQAELISARRFFPCWDEPQAKARFKISVKYFQHQHVLSNMPMSYINNEEYNMKTIYFTTTPVIAPREVAIALIQFASNKTSHIYSGVTVWHRLKDVDLKYMFTAIENCKEAFDMYIGEYKLMLKVDYILAPYSPMSIMGYPGLIICREREFTKVLSTDCLGCESNMLNLLGQEMARRWFGGIISPPTWSDFLFSEMIASFLNHILTEKLQNKAIQDLYAVQMVQSALNQDLNFRMKSILHKIDFDDVIEKNLYFPMYRNKGVALIRMLYYLFNPDDFRTGIRTYFANLYYTLDNLWSVLQQVLNERNKGWIYGVKEVMDTWLNQTSYPEVYVNRDHNGNTAVISQNNSYIIPIIYIIQSNISLNHTRNVTWLYGLKNETISGLTANDIIIVNVEQIGYYRVNYDLKSWKKIVHFSIKQNYKLIPEINRAQLIDDAFHFTMQGELKPFIFPSLVLSVTRGRSYIVWYSLFNIMSRMSTFLQLPQSENVRRSMLKSLGILLEKIGYEEHYNDDDMTKSIRLLAAKWACRLGLEQCKKAALSKLINHLAQSYISISSGWTEWIYCTGMEMADIRTWTAWKRKCIISQDITCLTYLACARNEDVLDYYLEMLLDTVYTDIFIKEAGILDLFHTLFKQQANNDYVLRSFINNQHRINDKIYKNQRVDHVKLLEKAIRTMYSITNINTMKTYGEFLTFKDTPKKRLFFGLIELRLIILIRVAKHFESFQ